MKRILSFALLTFATVAIHSPLSAKFSTQTRRLDPPEQEQTTKVEVHSKNSKLENVAAKPKKIHLRKGVVIRGANYVFSTDGLYINDAKIMIEKSIALVSGTVLGKGELRAPEISIQADKFEFRGTIECSTKCTITTKEPVDESLFKRKGTGQFIINGKEVSKAKSSKKKDHKEKRLEKAIFPPIKI